MPNWLAITLAILALIPLGALVTIMYVRREAARTEKRELRREGSAAVTPVLELARALGPEPIALLRDDQVRDHLQECRRVWFEERRPALMIYVNAHPDEIRVLAKQVEQRFQAALGATTWHSFHRADEQALDSYEQARARRDEALAAAEALLARIRR